MIVPTRLTAAQTAWFLGFKPEEITLLIAAGLLKPLGHPPRNGTKFFSETRNHHARLFCLHADKIDFTAAAKCW